MKRKKNLDPWFILLSSVFFLLHFFRLFSPRIPLWDESVYLAMGKYLFFFGKQGLWEIIRPVLLPFLLAPGAWLKPFDYIFYGKLLSLFFALLFLFLTYFFALQYTRSFFFARLAILFYLFFPLFNQWTTKVMTSIPAAGLLLLAVWFFEKQQWFSAGLFAGLAFLMRYPAGLGIVALGTALLFSAEHWQEKIKHLFSLGMGFATIVLPLFLVFTFAYGNPLVPFLEAVTHQANPFAAQPFSFYFSYFLHTTPLLFLGFLGLPFLWKKSQASFFMILYFFLYFLLIPNKQPRFLLLFLPFFVLAAIVFFSTLYLWANKRYSQKKHITNALVVSLFVLLLIPGISLLPQAYTDDSLSHHPLVVWYQNISTVPNSIIYTTEPLPSIFNAKEYISCTKNWNFFLKCYNSMSSGDYLVLTFYPFPEHSKQYYNQWLQDQPLEVTSHIIWNGVDYWLVRKQVKKENYK